MSWQQHSGCGSKLAWCLQCSFWSLWSPGVDDASCHHWLQDQHWRQQCKTCKLCCTCFQWCLQLTVVHCFVLTPVHSGQDVRWATTGSTHQTVRSEYLDLNTCLFFLWTYASPFVNDKSLFEFSAVVWLVYLKSFQMLLGDNTHSCDWLGDWFGSSRFAMLSRGLPGPISNTHGQTACPHSTCSTPTTAPIDPSVSLRTSTHYQGCTSCQHKTGLLHVLQAAC